jgi:hypothetical protein
MRPIIALLMLASVLMANELKCHQEEDRVYCTYFMDDRETTRRIKFHWYSPKSPIDDRKRVMDVDANNFSVYDYRLIYGRVAGKWKVVVEDYKNDGIYFNEFTIDERFDTSFIED